jgi:methionine--tRNA ligase beta chain
MKDLITYDQFGALDIRVGKIVSVSAPDWSRKLLKFEIDFGEEIGKRIIFSGIKDFYEPEVLVEKRAMFIVNLAPKKMGEEESQGMMLMADSEEKPTLIFVDDHVELGTAIR